MQYKVGDKVWIVGEWPKDGSAHQNCQGLMDKWLGKVMTIRGQSTDVYLMEEDVGERGSDGWVWWPSAIAGPAVQPQKIVVTTDGKTTTARMYSGKELVKTAEARCSDSDTFDFEKGAAIAIDRLLGRDVEKHEFTKADLRDGMFCRLGADSWFVIVGDRAVFEDGDYCHMHELRDDLTWRVAGAIEVVLEGVYCFNEARCCCSHSRFVKYTRPGAKFD